MRGQPGKFEGSGRIGERLHDLSLEGALDNEFGSVSEAPGRWWGLITNSGVRGAKHAIVTEDSSGFFDYEAYRSAGAAHRAFDRIVEEVSREMEAEEPEGYGHYGRRARGRAPTTVQSLVFDAKEFSLTEAKRWARDHGFKYKDVEPGKTTYRIRQLPPGRFKTFHMKDLRPGVKAVIAR